MSKYKNTFYTKPPLGLIPKKIHDEQVKTKRFNEVCEVISRYYNAGMKINIEWIEEYNELVESFIDSYLNNLLSCSNCKFENPKYDNYCDKCLNFNRFEKLKNNLKS